MQEVRAIKAHNLVLADGSGLEADEIVSATGYQITRETARTMSGDELANRVTSNLSLLLEVIGFADEVTCESMYLITSLFI